MEAQVLENYLKKVRELVSRQQDNLQADNHEIIDLIEMQKEASKGDPSDEAFLQGEENFYNGYYEQSLKHYLEAREIPSFQFFCYRASCLVSFERGMKEKALDYARKALRLDSTDPIVRQIVDSLDAKEDEADMPIHGECSDNEECTDNVQEFALQGAELNVAVQNCIQNTSTRTSDVHSRRSCEEAPKFFAGYDRNHSSQADLLPETTHGLEQRIRAFQTRQAEKMHRYLDQAEKNSKLEENALYVLNGWPLQASNSLLFTEESRKSCGGHYIRWNGKGIVINPGPGFLDNFHQEGLCIRNIDFVVVTCNNREAYGDVKAISELNHQLNKTSAERQIVHYYLHQKVYQELTPFLKPSFKQARNTIHKLEMYLDSPDVEKIELDEGIALHYFQATMPGSMTAYRDYSDENSSLGIRLELTNDVKRLKIGYLSGLAWSPLLAHHSGYCDIVMAAFGNTTASDYSKSGYNDDSLGYYGISTLLEELSPRLMLLTEFGGREGDIRIEVVKKMRAESVKNSSQMPTTVLAADVGLVIDLETLKVKCSISESSVAAKDVCVVASNDCFGRLRYLSTNYCY